MYFKNIFQLQRSYVFIAKKYLVSLAPAGASFFKAISLGLQGYWLCMV